MQLSEEMKSLYLICAGQDIAFKINVCHTRNTSQIIGVNRSFGNILTNNQKQPKYLVHLDSTTLTLYFVHWRFKLLD